MKDMYYLEARYDNRNSFYNKAVVFFEGDKRILYSYHTKVAEIKGNKAIVYGAFSQTTLRHIKEFLKQNGFKAENRKQILKDYKNI
jgi:hypothetical protein